MSENTPKAVSGEYQMLTRRKFNGAKEDKIFLAIVYIVLLLLFAVIILPLLHIVSASMSDPDYVMRGQITFYPQHLSFIAYDTILKTNP